MVIFSTLNSHADEEVLNSYKKISEVIKRVQAGERKALDDLMKIALGEHPLELSDQIKSTVIYGLTTLNETQKLSGFLEKIGLDTSDFYSDKKFKTACKDCEGEGHESADCKDCVFGKCKNCKGVGSIEYDGLDGEVTKSVCPKCLGSKKCLKCEGSGEMETDCASCVKGDVFNRNSVFSEYVNSVKDIDLQLSKKIAQMEKVDSVTETEVKSESNLSKKMNIEEDYKIKQTKNETKEELPEEKVVAEDEEPIKDLRLEASFNEVRRLIENHQNKHNQKICNEIAFTLHDNIPTMVLDLNDAFYNNISDSEKNVIHNFEKFWEARAFLNGYKGRVKVKLLNNDKSINGLLDAEAK